MTALLLFASTFAVVFALGLQSLNVNGGHRLMAFLTSFAIGASNLVLFKVLPGPTAGLEIAAYLLGGPFGIVASMLAHPHLVRLMRRSRDARTSDTPEAAAPHHNPFPQPEPERRQPHAAPPPAARPPVDHQAATRLCKRLLDPEDLGHAVNEEVRNAARRALGIAPVPIPAPRWPQRRIDPHQPPNA